MEWRRIKDKPGIPPGRSGRLVRSISAHKIETRSVQF